MEHYTKLWTLFYRENYSIAMLNYTIWQHFSWGFQIKKVMQRRVWHFMLSLTILYTNCHELLRILYPHSLEINVTKHNLIFLSSLCLFCDVSHGFLSIFRYKWLSMLFASINDCYHIIFVSYIMQLSTFSSINQDRPTEITDNENMRIFRSNSVILCI